MVKSRQKGAWIPNGFLNHFLTPKSSQNEAEMPPRTPQEPPRSPHRVPLGHSRGPARGPSALWLPPQAPQTPKMEPKGVPRTPQTPKMEPKLSQNRSFYELSTKMVILRAAHAATFQLQTSPEGPMDVAFSSLLPRRPGGMRGSDPPPPACRGTACEIRLHDYHNCRSLFCKISTFENTCRA